MFDATDQTTDQTKVPALTWVMRRDVLQQALIALSWWKRTPVFAGRVPSV